MKAFIRIPLIVLVVGFAAYDLYGFLHPASALLVSVKINDQWAGDFYIPATRGSTEDIGFGPYQLHLRVLSGGRQDATVEYRYNSSGKEIAHGTLPAGKEIPLDQPGLKIDEHVTLWASVKPVS